LAYFGSGGETEVELARVLGFDGENNATNISKDHIKKSYVFRRAFQVCNEIKKIFFC